ncbi:hypothetical protein [Aliarcobacter skirrowii]|jgi:hypothetical protein|uniref:Membrane protein n=1 Tax=Aliarcobacter skirrowii CCUG 10374 TaxID=1032239 RepID=A0AAD0SL98_9BACT|nr:hypothetical protein [Aliarcobacter skirrowii]AXX84713.1 putative membrane protein [Aliarcobacter skirrowii CCUG 10374]KAB0620257.1 hypothetical protein F7P70_08390 [Aliarcobacter skirrowii CCUG 10374]MDY0181481.1 hypothetical protein [Aliarcobacter skirrowii]RXI25440.1 hypothetical protein CP959_08420 [Aliarcobacter skirrowii CCUG 10374]SUV14885.1 Uncharacterised protein [Aliarcobacter skirrowii]
MKTFIFNNFGKISILILSIFIIFASSSVVVNESAKDVIDKSFNQALIVFGSAKALNAVISLAQGTEINLPFVVVAVGEVLDPINDLVEQFSLIMLASLVSLGIQKILLNFVSNDFFNLTFIISILVFNIFLFLKFKNIESIKNMALKLTLILLFLRFSIPFVAYLNEYSYDYFIKPQYNIEQLNETILNTKDEISKINLESVEEKESGFFEKFRQKFDMTFYEKKVDEYKDAVDSSSDNIVDLIIVFIFQTILLPLFYLFVFYILLKKLFNFPAK